MDDSDNLLQTWKDLGLNKTLEEQFTDRADFLMNKVSLVAGESKYRIVDCEVYYNSKQHPDPFPHSVVNKHDHQLNMGTWFFNDACGLDITFGDSEIYASFLIRAIQDLQSDERTEGITKVVREIFIQLGDVFSERAVLRLSFNNSHFCREELPFRTTRVN
jgi:hypothetical protein